MAPKQSKLSKEEQHSLAVDGMAWRVKYRKYDENGKVVKTKFQIGSLGVHQKHSRFKELRRFKTKSAFEATEDVSVTDVLIDSQRASVAFEATLQVRNKVLKAYQDVMSMPV